MEKKVWIGLLLILIIVYSMSISGKKGSIENAVMTVEKSEKFKTTEIETAIARVEKEFKGFTNCEMTKLYYDEEKSNIEINHYLIENKNVKNADKKISLFCILILMLEKKMFKILVLCQTLITKIGCGY